MATLHQPADPADPAAGTGPASDPSPAAGAAPEARRGADGLQAVLFDMDGLLVDTEPLWYEVECDVMARMGGSWTEADQKALVGGSLRRSVSYLLARAARPASEQEVARWMLDGMTALIGSRPLAMLPGAAGLLDQVRAAQLPAALVTSSQRAIMDAVLSQLPVTFTVTVCAEDVSQTKPDPQPYLLAAGRLGADPRHCAALEDSPTGVASAQAAGCGVVAVPSMVPISPQPGRLVASSLAEVSVAMLRDLVSGR